MRHFKLAAWSMALCVSLAQLGCGDDTPQGQQPTTNACAEGKNMTAPHLVNGVEPSAGGSIIHLAWDAGTQVGAELPSDYFAAAQVSALTDEEVRNLISDISLSAERELAVRFRNLGFYLTKHNTLSFVLAFPDRRHFSTCTHSGSDDTYLLRVSLAFDDQGQFQGATLTEELSEGST